VAYDCFSLQLALAAIGTCVIQELPVRAERRLRKSVVAALPPGVFPKCRPDFGFARWVFRSRQKATG